MSLAQATRSAAVRTISSQAALASKLWQVGQAGGFGLPDSVLDAGLLAMAQFQAGELPRNDPRCGVDDEGGDPHAVGVGEPWLRTRVRAFLAQDKPGSGRPGGQGDQAGGLGHPRPVKQSAPSATAAARSANTGPGAYTHGPL